MKTKYTLNETAEILGISRSNLYKKYLDNGKLSRVKDSNNKVFVDASEIARVCPEANFDYKKKKLSDISWNLEDAEVSQQKTALLDEKEREIKRLHEELKWHKQQIEQLNARLEYKPSASPQKKSGLLARLAKAVLDE